MDEVARDVGRLTGRDIGDLGEQLGEYRPQLRAGDVRAQTEVPPAATEAVRAALGVLDFKRSPEQVAALLALGGAVPLSAIPLAGYRAPVRPLPLNLAGQLPETPEQAEHWDTWFGMRAQWRPFWEVPELYTVAANDVSGPVASE